MIKIFQMKKLLVTILSAAVIAFILITVGCLKDGQVVFADEASTENIQTMDATKYNDIDREVIATRAVTPVDSIQALIDSLSLVILDLQEELDSMQAGGTFYVYASQLDYDFDKFGATGITKLKVTSSHTNNSVEIPADTDVAGFENAVSTLIVNEPAFEGSATSFSSIFNPDGTVLEYNLYSHISGVDSIFSAPKLYIDVEFTGDNRYDIRLFTVPQINAMLPGAAMDLKFDEGLAKVESTGFLSGINFNNSVLSEENITVIADELLTKEVTGTSCYFRNTNLPVSYRQLFLDQGWSRVIITN